MLKPGPKLGSVHRRRCLDHDLRERNHSKALRRTWTPEDPSGRQNQHALACPVPEPSVSDEAAQLHSKHIRSVYYLILPSHEESSPKSVRAATSPTDSSQGSGDILTSACYSLGVTSSSMKRMVENFFCTFTSFGLFRKPVFFKKLGQISSCLQLKALLAVVFAFACKGSPDDVPEVLPGRGQLSASDLGDLASSYVDKAMAECGDDQPPLCLLQALILVTHWMIIRGVRGRAWRSLGLCIRIAIELGLDLVDAGKDPQQDPVDADQWCEDEERRRAFWAIYEIDQFATIIKHVPMATNWTPSNVFLPADEDRWFQAQPHQSCFLDLDPIERSKTLQATGSESAKAWYIIVNSLVIEAYLLARRTGQKAHHPSESKGAAPKSETEHGTSSRNQCSTLLNSIQLCLLVMPRSWRFHGQNLDFGTQTHDTSMIPSILHRQSSIFHISILTEVARLLALRPYVFEMYVQRLTKITGKDLRRQKPPEQSSFAQGSTRELQQCFNASDAMLNIVLNCSEIHYQYVNPCIAHASWLAATVQLLQQELTEDESEKRLIQSQFEVLKATNNRFVQHWEMSTVPSQNLDALAMRLKQFTAVSRSLVDRENTPKSRLKNPSPGTDDKTSGPYVDELWQSKGNPGEKTRLDFDQMFSTGFAPSSSIVSKSSNQPGQSTNPNPPPPTPRPAPDPLPPEATFLQHQEPPCVTRPGLGDQQLSLYCQNPIFPDPTATTGSVAWLDTTATSWSTDQKGQVTMSSSLDSDPQGLFSFNTEIEGELSSYLDGIFSGPFIG
ncbi:uncharacterized protein Z518_03347 [Rhinocladiella mackenziei CBS 650.93]|uniref:Xylanolytic transcriptional activator regulatory domain-containing protein n=1 Tax=Rhinocladiella mackenziei CBS 650.93 TaxID=1442369 RepID=A0A0D2JH47_9EURO|nr:uncharacterized protein Z518_03347 [Rhinocladiella mackenziei CBS 650.93]KIX08690.1 hypothetical protein Z518_03347 [Rhinocladiella mackenziei CBS 650.93]